MWCIILTFLLYFQNGFCNLWPKGVVHYAINNKDYDVHSQDVIVSTLTEIEKEVCVKFFITPPGYNASERVLYINNPDKRKNCPPDVYNFTGKVVDMPIGYKCIDQKNIVRIIVDMLRASIEQTVPTMNSFDLIRKFQEMNDDPTRPYLLSPKDRNFINAHYHSECGALSRPRLILDTRRTAGGPSMTEENRRYYQDKVWPLAIVMYGVQEELRDSLDHKRLQYAMTTIELASGVVFQEVRSDDVLHPKSFLWFGTEGAEAPQLGFKEGNQSISLKSMAWGAPGHNSHTLNLLLRALGVPMMSNRPDRDNQVDVHWSNVEKGKEHYLEKYPTEAWIRDGQLPYDFDSATHAPANFMCSNCLHGESTVTPLQDHLWQRVLYGMGRKPILSDGDIKLLNIIYGAAERSRHVAQTH